MKQIGWTGMVYGLEFNLSADFFFQSSHVTTITHKEYTKLFPEENFPPDVLHGIRPPKRKKQDNPHGYLLIESTFELEKYDSLSEGSAKIRPQLLVIHGIITFLSNNMIISFQNFGTSMKVVKNHIIPDTSRNKLSAEGINLDDDLAKIITAIGQASQEKRVLIFTLFERWRKALYLENESEESFIHLDESVLAYVHILEVLSDEFKANFKQKIRQERKEIISDILQCASRPNAKSDKTISTLINRANELNVTLKSKVKQMLFDLNLFSSKSEAIVERFIGHRNAIAHGRKDIYQDKVAFPLKPFFSLIKDIDENIQSIKVLSAKLISNYLGLHAWTAEWDQILAMEFTPLPSVLEFIQGKKHTSLSKKDFLHGKIDGIAPFTLSYYYLKGKIAYKDLEECLQSLFLHSTLSEDFCRGCFDAAVVLADSTSPDLSGKSHKIIKMVHNKRWGYFSNIRDVLKEYEYHGKQLVWFAGWLGSR